MMQQQFKSTLACSLIYAFIIIMSALSIVAVTSNQPVYAKAGQNRKAHSHSTKLERQNFVPYRAVYDVSLENRAEKSDIMGLSGRMVYQFSGSKCDGWETKFRFLTKVDMKEDASRVTDRQGTSFESPDGKIFRFSTKNYLDGELSEEFSGTASRTKKGLEVSLEKPDGDIYKLKDADFPFMQMQEIIKGVISNQHFMKMGLFDGSDAPDDVTETTVIIGDKQRPSADDFETKYMGQYANDDVWPVTISYFDDTTDNDGLPSFRTEFLLYKNGITRNLFMDYGDFSIRGKLVHLDLLPMETAQTKCKS